MNGHLQYMPSSNWLGTFPFVMENLFPTFIPWDKKFKSTLHPDNVQIVTASFTGVHTIIRKHQFAHANLPVMILNVIFLISYRILKVLFTFYWKQTKMHIQNLGHITHMPVLQLASASTTFGCKENVNKEGAHSSSSVFKISMNKYSNHWHFII